MIEGAITKHMCLSCNTRQNLGIPMVASPLPNTIFHQSPPNLHTQRMPVPRSTGEGGGVEASNVYHLL